MLIEFLPDDDTPITIEERGCEGRYYRGVNTTGLADDGRIVNRLEMRPLHRLSCPGYCRECDWVNEMLSDDIGFESQDYLQGIKHNKLYKLEPWSTRDYYGEVDCGLNIVEVEETEEFIKGQKELVKERKQLIKEVKKDEHNS
jgi:hypothetical protein